MPTNGTLNSWSNVSNTTCAYCLDACTKPQTDEEFGFLEGFNWKIVGYSYLGYILFIIACQLIKYFVSKHYDKMQ